MALLKTLANSWYSERTFKRPEVSTSCAELACMFKKWKQSWNLLEPESFDVCKNAIAPIIVILGHSEVNYYKINYSLICDIWTLGVVSEV